MELYLLGAVVFAVLLMWWKMMSYTFCLIERAHEKLRESESRERETQPMRGKRH